MEPWRDTFDGFQRMRQKHGDPVVLAEFNFPGVEAAVAEGTGRIGASANQWFWSALYGARGQFKLVPADKLAWIVGGQVTSLHSTNWIHLHLVRGVCESWTDLQRGLDLQLVPPRQAYSACIRSTDGRPDSKDLGPGLILLHGWLTPCEGER